jgi:hypothetical protein
MTLFGTLRVKINTTKLIIQIWNIIVQKNAIDANSTNCWNTTYLFIFSCDAILKNTGKVKSHWKNMFPMTYLSSLEEEFRSLYQFPFGLKDVFFILTVKRNHLVVFVKYVMGNMFFQWDFTFPVFLRIASQENMERY